MMRQPALISILKYCLFTSLFVACGNEKNASQDEYAIATQDYVVLAEKAITQQGDFDMEGWQSMLADDAQFYFPNDTLQIKWVGKNRIIENWKNWKICNNIQSMSFSEFSLMPIQCNKSLKFSDLSGVYVLSFFKGKVTYHDGKTNRQQMNYCLHFNDKKLIDRYYTFSDRIALTQN